MAKKQQLPVLRDEQILSRIIMIRGKKVMLDKDLAELYNVSTKRLNEQVKRNLKRFPPDFMFQLTPKEKEEVVANCDHLQTIRFSAGLPYAFTEHGAVMLASVLNSDNAVRVNIEIVRIFTEMRHLISDTTQLRLEIEKIKNELSTNTKSINVIFRQIELMLELKKKPRKQIGYKITKAPNLK
jgi:hypothetical protein